MRGGAFFNGKKEGRDDFRKTAPESGYILSSLRVSAPQNPLRFKKFHQCISNSTIDNIRRLLAMHHCNNNHFISINQIKNHIRTNIEMPNLNAI